jgi:acyl carrier protein
MSIRRERRDLNAWAEGQMRTKEEALDRIRLTLVELFELDRKHITPEARLYDDLEIDSIDAVDLMDHLREKTGQRVKADEFRSVRTVGDLVDVVLRLSRA